MCLRATAPAIAAAGHYSSPRNSRDRRGNPGRTTRQRRVDSRSDNKCSAVQAAVGKCCRRRLTGSDRRNQSIALGPPNRRTAGSGRKPIRRSCCDESCLQPATTGFRPRPLTVTATHSRHPHKHGLFAPNSGIMRASPADSCNSGPPFPRIFLPRAGTP